MSLRRRLGLKRFGTWTAALLVLAGFAPEFSNAQLAGAETGAARLETFAPANGEGYFALSLAPAAAAKPTVAVGHDVLVLVDTSASQVNRFREKAFEALDFFLAGLGPNDRVQLAAVDLNFIPLTASSVAPASDELKAALVELRGRTPLGSTDMATVLKASAATFPAEQVADRERSVVYIGDGMSTAGLVGSSEMQGLLDALVAKRAAVSSFGIGPRIDVQLLGVLANHTGGLLVVDVDDPEDKQFFNGKQAGAMLTQAALGSVAWPVKAAYPTSMKEAFPKNTPPLRFDRDSIVIGVGAPTGQVQFGIQAEVVGRPVDLQWNVAAVDAADDHSYLPELISSIRKDGGVTLPTVGSAGLSEMRRLAFVGAYQLLHLGKQAAAMGNYVEAERLLNEALRKDPNNGEAKAAKEAVIKARAEGKGAGPRELRLINFQQNADPAAPAAAADPNAVLPAPAAAVPPVAAPANDEDAAAGSLLEGAAKERKVIMEIVTTEVQNGLNEARSVMGRSPDSARATLKALVDKVQGVPELDGAVKSQLLEQIQTALRTADRQAKVEEERRVQTEAVIARQQEQDRLFRDLIVGQQKTEQLMARFENLMDERRYLDARSVAMTARENSNSPVPNQAIIDSQHVDIHQKTVRVYEQKWAGYIDANYQIERSSVPFADDPPVVYPPKDVWELLTERRKKWDRVDLATSNETETRIREELDKKTEVQYLDTQLGDVVTDLELRHRINIELDNEALAADGKGSETPITKSLKDVTLRSALRLILDGQGLTYLIKNEVMLITTKAAASQPENLETRVYPVADLVIPIPQGGMSGFGGLGGGMMGGGMGGGGGGMMGGGMGGGGGGAGGGGGFFAVEDDLRLSGSKPAVKQPIAPAARAPVAPQTPAAAAVAAADEDSNPILLKLEPGADVAKVWEDHFTAHQPSSAAVRSTVRVLMKTGKPDQAAAVIMAALRHNQAQPWMYEALGLAMEMQGARVSEIERTLMSSVDFSTQPDDLLRVAEYMVKANLAGGALKQRALGLYHQVAKLQPARPDPYVLGLRLAQHINDVEGLKWSTLGILNQAWPSEQKVIFDEAQRTAIGLLERLRVEKRTAEADAFQAAMKAALVRDCVVTVSWSGDADVDLIVEEPAGTMCSFRVPRTTSGGVLIGDTFDKTTGLRTETYVCPIGFNGDYRMLAKRVWGKVIADTLTVEIINHQGAPNERRQRKVVPVEKDQAAIAFNLQNGRRTESLEEIQVANAVQSQVDVGRHILAQRIGNSDVGGTNPFDPRTNPGFYLRGAVGYQPLIITLPTGTNMSVTAVVSHDRRYVRVSAQPLFSTIPNVNTFNYSSGSSGTSNGASGSGT